MAMFHVGQKVVCVDASPNWLGGHVTLVERAVYAVCAVHPAIDPDGEYGVEVVGERTTATALLRPGFRASRFRPVTDISALEALLTSRPSDLPAERVEVEVPVLCWCG